MESMELYVSGIYRAKVILEVGAEQVSLLDPMKGEFGPMQPLTEEACTALRALTKWDFSKLAQRLAQAAPFVEQGVQSFTLPDGAIYEKKDENHYIQRQIKFPVDLIVHHGKIVGAQTANRENVSVLVQPDKKDLTILPRWEELYPQKLYAIEQAVVLQIPMRDGILLAADLWLPKGIQEPIPCVLVRTPYGRQAAANNFLSYVQRGYAVVIQDVRGRNDSEGDWCPSYCETEDGSDTLDWIAEQSWCNGNIGTIGGSYLGYVQWAAAASGNPHLKAIVSEVTAGNAFDDMPRSGGTLSSGTLAWAFSVSQRKMNAALMERDDWDEVLAYRPLTEVCQKALGYDIPFWQEWLAHPCNDEFWKQGDWYERAMDRGGIDVPALIMSGWFDDNGMGTTQALDLTKDYPAGKRKVILGPWMHSGNANYDLHGVEMGSNALRYDIDLQYFSWFEQHLRGRKVRCSDEAPVEYFTLGQNRWKTAEQWPPERAKQTALYLGGSCANTSSGNGLLLKASPEAEGTDTITYDPADPATHIIDVSENEIEVPEDYAQQEQRADYLCYTTPPLEQDLVITGDAMVELFVSSDAPDTDIVVRLTQVEPSGRSIKLADGILDMKFREGFEREIFMEPGQVYPIHIRTTKISVCIPAGQRLRFTVTSSAKNLAFPNSNTKRGYLDTETQIAHNTLHYGGKYPARILFRQEEPEK